MRATMQGHLDQTLTEAAHELQGQYAASVADYETIHEHILEMAACSAPGSCASSRSDSADASSARADRLAGPRNAHPPVLCRDPARDDRSGGDCYGSAHRCARRCSAVGDGQRARVGSGRGWRRPHSRLPVRRWVARRERLPAPLVDDVVSAARLQICERRRSRRLRRVRPDGNRRDQVRDHKAPVVERTTPGCAVERSKTIGCGRSIPSGFVAGHRQEHVRLVRSAAPDRPREATGCSRGHDPAWSPAARHSAGASYVARRAEPRSCATASTANPTGTTSDGAETGRP